MNKLSKKTLMKEIGSRFERVRGEKDYSRAVMAAHLNLTPGGYAKYERGDGFPSVLSLAILLEKFDLSLDWLVFNKGPMHFSEIEEALEKVKQYEEEKAARPPEDSELNELLAHIKEDPRLRHELFSFFYNYIEKKQKESGK